MIISNNVMFDLETLGTNNDSQVISIGACVFNKKGEILDTFYSAIKMCPDVHVKATPSTLLFWLGQGSEAFRSVMSDHESKKIIPALTSLSLWLVNYSDNMNTWANGTKFDIGMLERLYLENSLSIPWIYNSDKCMRTVKGFAKKAGISVEVGFEGRPHHALDDAIWQAKYVAEACNKLGLEL
tara:strand:- start:530 stop:1078 length:549 start_codon:yes stop_codon:yes gene_type:complete